MPGTGISSPGTRRRWLQFSLRTALLLFVVWAALLTWYVHYSRPMMGKVRLVQQQKAIVWIDMGRADGLSPKTTFNVHSVDASGGITARRKGVIQVTLLLGDHLAEARIIEDAESDPIVPGNHIRATNTVERFFPWLSKPR